MHATDTTGDPFGLLTTDSDEVDETEYCEHCQRERPASYTRWREIMFCAYCRGHDLDEYKRVISRSSAWVQERHGASKATSAEVLVGLDPVGRAVYADGIDGYFTIYAPANADPTLYPGLADTLEQERWRARPVRYTEAKPDPGPCIDGEFVTLANGDHIVRVDSIDPDDLDAHFQIGYSTYEGVAELLARSPEPWLALTQPMADRLERFDHSDVIPEQTAIVELGGDA